ncbi:MAG: DUF4369 domain-containing protein [Bacteroidales bacterium]|nr:DUF4369 domain-containing protein [Bacteroidales bacterium]
MKKIICFFLAVVLLCSCGKNSLHIKGQFENARHRQLYLSLLTTDGLVLLDSTRLHRNAFDFCVKANDLPEGMNISDPLFLQLSFSRENALTTLAQFGQTVEIRADANDLIHTYKVKGPIDTKLMWQLDSALAVFVCQTDTLMQVYQTYMHNDSVRSAVEYKYNRLTDAHTQYLRDFIGQNPHSLSSVIAFYQVYNNRRFLEEKTDVELFHLLVDSLSATYPNNEYVKYLQRRRG